MKIDIKYKPGFAMADIVLGRGEELRTEAGTMVSKSPEVTMRTEKAQSGVFRSLKAAFFGGESFWMNIFSSSSENGLLKIAPTLPGDIEVVDMDGATLLVQSSSFLAADHSVEIDTRFQGLKGLVSGESLFFLALTGKGPVLLSSYGGIERVEVTGKLTVDTGHIVAFDSSLDYKINKFGGWKNFFLGSEGFVAVFSGRGRVWIQSRNAPVFGSWLGKMLPPRRQ